ncbi:hypothetical protein [Dechloromonas denitrificans]|uniref:hypothetical protein n=1 Tax=Dechloromonas denitrificans TaxID=281362 RepID=UPI001CF899F4|nr:hypothetical protein [Dechloromonas denitrificans]UCV01940.1 hypothetical protein KI611_12555 [Dechloromonas denitrificans]UCV06274.1 hypothetical protein KI615_12630 [Dechloromonas denitrificans]
MLSSAINLLVALAALVAGSVLALNYPIGQFTAFVCFLLCALLVFYRPSHLLVIIPAILPVIGFAPWTGWISFEELDLLILASAAGGYARCGIDGRERSSQQRTSSLCLVLATLMSISILISMTRGFADAGGFHFSWFQGYDGPMNSLRIGKSFFFALLLIPLITRFQDSPENKTGGKLALGIAIGLGAASLAALWERLAFTDLLNFSSDYRSTALFWEMHVGGAALDGWLLLTFPFAIWALRNSRSTVQFALSMCLIGLGLYAALTTFSRGVYLALIISLPLLAWQTRGYLKPAVKGLEPSTWGIGRWMIALVFLGAMAALVFPTGGYRALSALLGLVAISISIPFVLRGMSFTQFFAGGLAGLLSGTLLVVLANFLPKGPYVLYGLLFFVTFLTIYWQPTKKPQGRAYICTTSFVALMLSAANVADFWGGVEALRGMGCALSMLFVLFVWNTFSRQPLWPNDLRWQGGLLTTAVATSAVIAVFVGGGYMEERFSTSGKDLDGRKTHWAQTIGMLQTPWDMTFGKGLGRFPANYYFAIPTGDFPGTYQIKEQEGNSMLSLSAPRHPMSFGDILRVSQRIDIASDGPFSVELKVRAKADVAIHAEVCEKHLLYVGNCAIGQASIKATHGEWQSAHIRLEGPALNGGPWYAPRLKMFSLGIGNQSGTADIDDVVLTTVGSENLLENSGFNNQMQRWFFSSDHDHMPWHAKNLLVNVMFDQGTLGLMVFLLLTASALWRLNLGRARQHELAPYLTAAIIGFLAVGMFDSLTDVPRLAFLYYLLILYALSIGLRSRRRTSPQFKHAASESPAVR